MKKVVSVICIMLLSMYFVGCSPKAEVESSGDTPAVENAGEQAEDVGEISVWIPGDEAEYKFYFDMFENYKVSQESKGKVFNYKIEQQPWGDYWTKLPLEANNGRGPDLFMTHMAYSEVLLPISRELDFSQETLDKFTISDLYVGDTGKPVFIPTSFVCKIMYANGNIVNDFDVPSTWDDFFKLSNQYNDQAKGIVGFDYFYPLLFDLGYQNGDMLTDAGEIVYNSHGLETIKEWTDKGYVDYLTFGNGSPEDSVYEDSAAFIYGEPWMAFWAPDTANLKAFPVPGGKTHSYAELSFGINKNVADAKYDVLNDFIEFTLTDEKTITDIVKGNSAMPNNKEIEIQYEALTAGDAVFKSFESGSANLCVPPRGIETNYNTMLETVLTGGSIQDAMDEAKRNSEDINIDRLIDMEDRFRDKIK